MIEELNAVIVSAELDVAERGSLLGIVTVDLQGGGTQGFGPYFMCGANDPGFAGRWVTSVLRVTGAGTWARLPGKVIRVRKSGGLIRAIGHPIQDLWFDPEEAPE